MDWQEAAARLDLAFAQKGAADDAGDARPRVGVFGNGLPEALLLAVGCRPVDVKSVPDGAARSAGDIDAYVEPFVDDHARLFLNRLFGGAFAGLPAIVFSRDDAAGLVAYQYALEFMRLHGRPAGIPRLLLWNAVPGEGAAVAAFNRRQAEQLWADLAGIGARAASEGALAEAIAREARRAAVLAELESCRQGAAPTVSGAEALRWRNAGRFLAPEEHARLLDAVIAALRNRPPRTGLRIGLVGAATDAESLYAALEAEGTVVCDPQPFGTAWPGPVPASPSLDALLEAAARDPLLQRAKSATARRAAIVAACVGAGCDLVAAQIDQNDDTFGWEWPSLAAELARHGITTVNLGFRDYRPDTQWCDAARARIAGFRGNKHD